MNQFGSLPLLDLISLILFMFIGVILLINRSLMVDPEADLSQSTKATDHTATLTAGISFEPDAPLDSAAGDTNDPLLIVYNARNRYLGPDQTALALTLLDPDKPYTAIKGHIPADHPTYIDPSETPKYLGSADPSAGPSLFLLNPAARLGEEALEGSRLAVLPVLRAAIILLALIPLLYRLLVG